MPSQKPLRTQRTRVALRASAPEPRASGARGQAHLERIALAAEAAGFDLLWIDAASGSGASGSSALHRAAALAGITARIGLGAAIPVPSTHPLRSAEDAATADGLCAGRLELWLRPVGGGATEASGIAEEIAVLAAAWSDVPVRHEGARHRFEQIDVHPKPARSGGPPLWLAADDGGRGAAAAGVGAMAASTAEGRAYLEEWAAQGREPARARLAIESARRVPPEGVSAEGLTPLLVAARADLAELSEALGERVALDLILRCDGEGVL